MYRWSVIEDNGGGLHLYVLADRPQGGAGCVYAHSGFEHTPGALRECLRALADGDTAQDWDGGAEDPQAEWGYWTEENRRNGGWKVVADDDGIYKCEMGRAALLELGGFRYDR